jgi:hypothetical protein
MRAPRGAAIETTQELRNEPTLWSCHCEEARLVRRRGNPARSDRKFGRSREAEKAAFAGSVLRHARDSDEGPLGQQSDQHLELTNGIGVRDSRRSKGVEGRAWSLTRHCMVEVPCLVPEHKF